VKYQYENPEPLGAFIEGLDLLRVAFGHRVQQSFGPGHQGFIERDPNALGVVRGAAALAW
jgi:hypothetical protein